MQFPLLHDPNVDAGLWLYDSEAIIAHLFMRYGPPRPVWQTLPLMSSADAAASFLAGVLRRRGLRVLSHLDRRPQPERLPELWNFEASPYCRKVREVLAELGLDALIHNVGKRGRRRPELVALGGRMQVPYLVDPNTSVSMYESDDIIAYLRKTYG
jgi:glutathione S-transferase